MDIDIFARQLRMERLQRGWTLKQVSDLTRISITVIKLLEEGSFEKIGGEHTVEMLLRNYSKALGDEGPSLGSIPAAQSGSGGLSGLSGSYLFTFLAAGLIVAVVIAALGLVYHKFGTGAVSSNAPIPDARIEVPADRSRIDQSNLALEDAKKKELSKGEEPMAVSPAGTEKHADELGVNNLAPGGEQGNTAVPGGKSAAAGPAREEQQESSAKEDAVLDGKPGSASTSENEAFVPEEKSGSGVAQSLAASKTRSIDVSHLLEMNAAQKTWIQVTVDGIKPESELLQPGDRRKWKASKKVDLVIGNRGGVQLRWDGQPVELGGKTARVIRLSLSDSGVVLK